MVEITITSLTPSRFYNCPKPKPGLPMSYVMVCLCSMISGERLLFVMLILVEFLTI
jgi:hypothetical protein